MVYQNGNAIAMSFPSSGVASQDIYSTEETVIGQWIDGKPLYRKVFQTITPKTEALTSIVNISNLNADVVVSLTGWITQAAGVQVYFDTADIPGNWYCRIMRNNNNINCQISVAVHKGAPCCVIVMYTKTTDQATIEIPVTLAVQGTGSSDFGAQSISASAATVSIASAESVEFENVADEDA